jgi:hypothetical protein
MAQKPAPAWRGYDERADARAVFATSGGELADARSMGEDELRRFFDRRF